MTGRRITTGLSLLCALVCCALTASSASAEGTTYFECAKHGGNFDFKDADCSEGVPAGSGEYGHVVVTTPTSTPVTITQTSAKSKLMAKIGGITTTLEATGFSSKSATVNNGERASKEMLGTGKGEGTYTGVTLVEGPEGCKVKEGTAKQLSTNSETVPASMKVEFKPVGAILAEFTFEGCKTVELNTTFKVTGNAIGVPKGAFLDFTEANTKTLKVGGQEAFFIATDTVKMESGNALSLTTTTP